MFEGTDSRFPDRISIPMADDDNWLRHVLSTIKGLRALDGLLTMPDWDFGSRELDIAIEPEDYNALLSEWNFDCEFLSLLVPRRISLNISIYGRGGSVATSHFM